MENIMRNMINLDLLKVLFFDTRDLKEFCEVPKLDLKKLVKIHMPNMKYDYDYNEDKTFMGKYENKYIKKLENMNI